MTNHDYNSKPQAYQRTDTHTDWKMALSGLLNWNMDLKKCKKLSNCDNTTLKFLQS